MVRARTSPPWRISQITKTLSLNIYFAVSSRCFASELAIISHFRISCEHRRLKIYEQEGALLLTTTSFLLLDILPPPSPGETKLFSVYCRCIAGVFTAVGYKRGNSYHSGGMKSCLTRTPNETTNSAFLLSLSVLVGKHVHHGIPRTQRLRGPVLPADQSRKQLVAQTLFLLLSSRLFFFFLGRILPVAVNVVCWPLA